jgi:hypothetical protein
MLTGVRPVLITPEIKTANEIACDRGWNKLYPSPIYVTLLEMVYKESPLCSWGSAFGLESAKLLLACLIYLLLESFGALSVSF